jgi:serine protease AprX
MRRILFLLAIILFSSQRYSAQAEVDNLLLADKNATLDYIVILKTNDIIVPDYLTKEVKGTRVYNHLVQQAKSQKSIIEYLQNNNIYYETFFIINGLRVKSNKDILQKLASRKEVTSIIRNVNLSYAPYTQDRESSRDPMPEWGITKIQADSVWKSGIKGKGVVIGGADTGYEWNLSPLAKKYKGYINDSTANHNYSWHDGIKEKSPLNNDTLNPCGFNSIKPCDDDDHGTHTMGTMVGQDSNNIIGVAPESKWIGCRNMERGWGKLSSYLDCFQWFLAPTEINNQKPDPKQAPHVINNSWYCSPEEGCNISNWSALEMAVNNLYKAGVFVVVSAGNEGPACNTIRYSPAIFSNSFSVGATDIEDNIASFSSRGNVSADSSFRMKPDVSAPGRSVRSVARGGVFKVFSGTSMAGPHVAGLVALMINANPKLSGQTAILADILKKSADPKTSTQVCSGIQPGTIPNPVFGWGRINAVKAIALARATIVSTKESEILEFIDAYPNPTTDNITLETGYIDQTLDYRIYNSTGSEIKSGSFRNVVNIDISTYLGGLYILQVSKDGLRKNIKIVKQ